MTYATATDVTDRLGKPADADLTTLITTRLADAERMIKRSIPDLADKVTAGGADYLADVVQVESEAVLRLARNPEGYLSETDGSYTYQFIQSIASGILEILPSEWETLGVTRRGLTQIVPTVKVPYFRRGEPPWWWFQNEPSWPLT